jgi:hypothetical protein
MAALPFPEQPRGDLGRDNHSSAISVNCKMAIKLEFINLIVPNSTLEAVFVKQGGFEFLKHAAR